MTPEPNYAPGTRVGAFEIVRPLARGGMSTLYVARDAGSGELVALKFLASFTPAGAVRFEREARIVARLDHPNVVRGRTSGRTPDGLAWLAMELLAGESLRERLRRTGVLAPAAAVDLALQVCAALEHAHAAQVVHRDLKPENIFLCAPEGGGVVSAAPAGTTAALAAAPARVKVVDFGIAQLPDGREMTATGVPIGTWAYMSPEQARGDADVDLRTDIWSVGVVLFECLTGRPPFRAESPSGTLFQILCAPVPELRALRPELPVELAGVVARALSRARSERYASATALREALTGVAVRLATRAAAGEAPSAASPAARFEPDEEERATGGEGDEQRLVSVVCLQDLRDSVLVEAVAGELDGRCVALRGGDAVVVLFGAERWRGDEPRRAATLASLCASAARAIGVATGRALRRAQAVTGRAVDAAAALAHEGGPWLDAATAAAVRSAFALAPAGRAYDTAAGVGAASRLGAPLPPGAATEATGPSPALASSSAATADAPFVGREIELALLLRSAEEASAERGPSGAVVLGAPGMGKSRLRREAVAALIAREPAATVLWTRCEAFRRDSPFAALREALTHVLDPSLAAVFAPPPREAAVPDAVAWRDRAHASLETLLRGVAARGTVVLAFDDAQWLDPTSRAAVRWLCEQAADLPLAVWLFARPEARELTAEAVPGAASLELRPLARGACEQVLRALLGRREVPAAVLERAAGHPLFLEELGRRYAAARDTATGGEGDAATSVDAAALPPSVEGALLAQLDELAPAAREFAKRAAVYGQGFWVAAVEALGGDGAQVAPLTRAGLIAPRARPRFPDQREYAFRAGLLRDVAYGLWPETPRAQLHARAAAWLAARPGGAPPDELARHWDLAGDRARAAEAYALAAEATARAADAATARAHAARVLALSEEPRLRWRALCAQDDALQLAGEREARARGLAALCALAAQIGPGAEAEAAWRACYHARMVSEPAEADEAAARAIALAARAGEPRWSAAARIEQAYLSAERGETDAAQRVAAQARALAEGVGDAWLATRAVAAQAYVAGLAGELLVELELCEAAARGFAATGDRRREALVRGNAGSTLLALGRVEEAAAQIEAAIAAGQRVGNARSVAAATHTLGVARRLLGAAEQGRQLQRAALGAAEAQRHHLLRTSVRVEQVYLALAASPAVVTPAQRDALLAAAAEAEAAARDASTPALAVTSEAVALRARGRAGLDVSDAVAAGRARLAQVGDAQARAELALAVYEAGGRDAADAGAAREALARLLDSLAVDPEERAPCRGVYAARWLVPRELLTDDAAT